MATFLVGQRVRISRWLDGEFNFVGREAIVLSDLYEADDGQLGHDLHVFGEENIPGDPYWAIPEELEPIQPERNSIIAWEYCLIDPRKLIGEPECA